MTLELTRSKSLGLVPTALGALGLAAVIVSAVHGVTGPIEAWATATGLSVAFLVLGLVLVSRPHRIHVGPDRVEVRGRFGLFRRTFERGSLSVEARPGATPGRVALEGGALLVLLVGIAALRAPQTSVIGLGIWLYAIVRYQAWRRAEHLELAGVDGSGRARRALIRLSTFDASDQLRAALLPAAEPQLREPVEAGA